MSVITLKAHYDGKQVCLDEPIDLAPNTPMLVTVAQPDAEAADRAFLHRGIAARGFVRSFVLADGMEVEAALLEHGLLHVDVVRPEPSHRVKSIPIRTAG